MSSRFNLKRPGFLLVLPNIPSPTHHETKEHWTIDMGTVQYVYKERDANMSGLVFLLNCWSLRMFMFEMDVLQSFVWSNYIYGTLRYVYTILNFCYLLLTNPDFLIIIYAEVEKAPALSSYPELMISIVRIIAGPRLCRISAALIFLGYS